MVYAETTSKSAVLFVLDGIAPERKDDLVRAWDQYGPEFQLLDDNGPDGKFVLEGGLFKIVRFNHRVMRLFWLGAFIAWEGYVALHKQLTEGSSIDLTRFIAMLDIFRKIQTANDSASVPFPSHVPEPGMFSDDPQLRTPGELAVFCVGWALLHEFKHIQHQQDGTSAPYDGSKDELQEEEFSCDEYATKYILELTAKYASQHSVAEELVYFKRTIGIYFAIFTMTLIAADNWGESESHPSFQNRIVKIREHMGHPNMNMADAIAHAAFSALWVLWPNAPGPFKKVR